MVFEQDTEKTQTVIARNEVTKQSRKTLSHPCEGRDLSALSQEDPKSSLGCEQGDGDNINTRLTPALIWANELGKHKTLENKTNRQKQWTAKKRDKQAEIIQKRKPWLKSTGAKTVEGKERSLQNAWKHGFFSADMREIKRLLIVQRRYVKKVNAGTWENIRDLHAIRAKEARMKLTLQQLVKDIKSAFDKGGMDVSMRDIKMMIHHVTGHGEEVFITQPDTLISGAHKIELDKMVARRINGEPLTRIMGVREFWGLEFEVTSDTLDPRADTETLVEAVLAWAFKKAPCPQAGGRDGTSKPIRILDLGTGTGCIPIALLSELPNATAVALDYSYEAACVARRNAEKYKMSDRLQVIQGDWMSALKSGSFDLIVSNPPYISNEVIQNLDDEVKNHDPFLSLSGGDDGLDCYKKIISALKIHLNDGSRAFLEIGFDQLESVSRLVDESGLCVCDSRADIAGNPRVVEICSGDK
jgi:release factor glutamine methyltransferase